MREELSVAEQTPGPDAEANIGNDVESGWIRIKLSEEASPLRTGAFTRGEANSGNDELDRIAASLGATEVRRVFSDGGKFAERRRRYGMHLWYDVKFDDSVPVSRAASEFSAMEGVEIIEPIYRLHSTVDESALILDRVMYRPVAVVAAETEAPFDDPRLGEQWHYHNVGGSNTFVAGADINLFEAWQVETGSPNVIVSVHDNGMSVTHPDLAAHMWVNEAEENGAPGVDDDGNGYIDDIHGWNYIDNTPDIIPEGHGTHVAGTIAAINGNGEGVCGVAGGTGPEDGARIMSLEILYGTGSSSVFSERATETYAYAADNGSVISQNSWTLGDIGILPTSYRTAFTYFIENAGFDENGVQTGPMAGGIIIFAAGNAGGETLLPASSDLVVAVAAMAPDYSLATYSSHGQAIDILAPGGSGSLGYADAQVLSTYCDGGVDTYTQLWGTSMACPHVSGVAALIVSKYGGQGFTADDCKRRLLNGYKPMGGLVADDDLGSIGVGLLDAAAALMDDPGQAPGNIEDVVAEGVGNTIELTYTVPADANNCAVAKIYVTYTADGEEPATQEIVNIYDVDTQVTYALQVAYNKSYDLSMVTEDRWGNRVADENAVTASAETDNFENVAPTVSENIPSGVIPSAGADNIRTYDLSEYFYDRNTRDGDVLTYSASSSNTAIVECTIEGSVLTINPKARGTASVTVRATDLAGESVEMTFRVTVSSGPEPGSATMGLSIMSANLVEEVLTFNVTEVSGSEVEIAVYDAAARKVYSGTVSIVNGDGTWEGVATLSPGVYTLRVTNNGQSISGSFVKA